jgi:AraC-like DNA-binding protein
MRCASKFLKRELKPRRIIIFIKKSKGMKYREKITDIYRETKALVYWEIKEKIENKHLILRYIPKAMNVLIFNFGDTLAYMKDDGFIDIETKVFIVPYSSESYFVKQTGYINMFGVSFYGNGIYRLVRMPMNKLLDLSLPYSVSTKFSDIYEKVQNQPDFDSKTEIMKAYLLSENYNDNKTHLTDNAIEIINQKKGNINIGDIASELNISSEYLQKMFRIQLGISPKTYSKIHRFQCYIDYILHNTNKVDWMDLVVEFDYHDQPHLINEVKAITGLSPTEINKLKDSFGHYYSEGAELDFLPEKIAELKDRFPYLYITDKLYK